MPFDALLELHVRDGLVYYRALQADRGRLSRYIASLNSPSVASGYEKWSADQKKAFWLNAYNALVMQTVIDHYPIRGTAKNYPANSIRQIPGAFEKTTHAIAGKQVTLDQIENTVLADLDDPRVYLALGRGAIGSGRLRSEAFSAKAVDKQLAQIKAQFAVTPRWSKVDMLAGKVSISPILSWRSPAFIKEYADDSFDLPKREPIERRSDRIPAAASARGGRRVHQEEHLPAHLRAVRLAAERLDGRPARLRAEGLGLRARG